MNYIKKFFFVGCVLVSNVQVAEGMDPKDKYDTLTLKQLIARSRRFFPADQLKIDLLDFSSTAILLAMSQGVYATYQKEGDFAKYLKNDLYIKALALSLKDNKEIHKIKTADIIASVPTFGGAFQKWALNVQKTTDEEVQETNAFTDLAENENGWTFKSNIIEDRQRQLLGAREAKEKKEKEWVEQQKKLHKLFFENSWQGKRKRCDSVAKYQKRENNIFEQEQLAREWWENYTQYQLTKTEKWDEELTKQLSYEQEQRKNLEIATSEKRVHEEGQQRAWLAEKEQYENHKKNLFILGSLIGEWSQILGEYALACDDFVSLNTIVKAMKERLQLTPSDDKENPSLYFSYIEQLIKILAEENRLLKQQLEELRTDQPTPLSNVIPPFVKRLTMAQFLNLRIAATSERFDQLTNNDITNDNNNAQLATFINPAHVSHIDQELLNTFAHWSEMKLLKAPSRNARQTHPTLLDLFKTKAKALELPQSNDNNDNNNNSVNSQTKQLALAGQLHEEFKAVQDYWGPLYKKFQHLNKQKTVTTDSLYKCLKIVQKKGLLDQTISIKKLVSELAPQLHDCSDEDLNVIIKMASEVASSNQITYEHIKKAIELFKNKKLLEEKNKSSQNKYKNRLHKNDGRGGFGGDDE